MALIPWDPFKGLDKIFEENWVPMFPVWKPHLPAMDVYQTDKEVIAEINLPGIDPSKVEVSIENNVLYVSGKSEEKREEKKKDYAYREIRRGSFERAVALPADVKESKAKATYKDGVLKIVVPKSAAARKVKKIKVKAERKK
jgi:HSP20 family protein